MSNPASILAVLCVKNEGAFLIEWLAHHRACGFTDFLVLSNDCDDGTDAMLDRLEDLGWLTHVRNPGPHPKGAQWHALALADAHPLVISADWVLVCDIDEFVNIHVGDRSVQALMSALPQATAITLTWRLFGNAGVEAFEDRPVTEQFTLAAPAIMGWPWRAAMFKTLFTRNGDYGKLGVHRPRAPDKGQTPRWFDGSGRELPATYHRTRVFSPYGRDNYALAQMNHYAVGAMESYLVKCDRGRANRESSAVDMAYWVERNFCSDEDRSIAALAPASAPLRAGLLGDADLGALHHRAVDWRHARVAALLQHEQWRALLGRLMLAGKSTPLSPSQALRLRDLGLIAARGKDRDVNGGG